MNLKHKACTLFFLLFSTITSGHAEQIPQTSSKPVTENAFYLDNKLWLINPATQTYDIPYCWENLSVIERNSTVNRRRNVMPNLLAASWGLNTRLRFKETSPAQSRPVGALPLYTGIRIKMDPYKKVTTLSGKIVESPYVLAVGTQIKNRPDGVVLDLSVPLLSKLYKSCPIGVSDDQCVYVSIIHEFGHVIGMSHEQNRSDATIGGSCQNDTVLNDRKDPPVGIKSTDILFGNIRIDDYDISSIMNYCNPVRPYNLTISPTDKLAAQIYYGNMPNLNAPAPYTGKVGQGILTLRIPSLKIGTTWYSAVITRNIDANRDGAYDNVYTLKKTPIPGNINVSSYPVTVVNGVMNVKMLKRTVIASGYPALDGKVAYLGYREFKPIAGTVDKWYQTSIVGDYNAQYPIKQGK